MNRKIVESFFRSPETIRKEMEIRSQSVNSRISFDLCPEIETALKEKGILSKFEMNSMNEKKKDGRIDNVNKAEEPGTYESILINNSFEKSKSLYEFEDLEAVCNKTLNVLSETQLNDVIEPSGFWNCSLLDSDQSPKIIAVNSRPSTILEESGSTTKSFETACISDNSSYFTATAKSVIDQQEVFTTSSVEDNTASFTDEHENSLIILSDSNSSGECENFDLKKNEISQKLEFNDTLEEIEFIMTKGKDYIKNVVEKVTFSINDETDTDCSKENMYKSKLPTPQSSKILNKQSVPFKKPLSSVPFKKIDFNHIRSPIGEYIKKTAKSPMILSAKPDTNIKQSKKLIFESNNDSSRRNPSTIGTTSLPKKAYISSETKKYTDERPAFSVPGGPKIQNHIKSSRMMGVVKHEGKIRMSPKPKDDKLNMQTSFSNLSLASGDISFYTLKK